MARKSRKENAGTAVSVPAAGKKYKTALYVRLSSEDERKMESDTVENQKALLMEYVDGEESLMLTEVYVDRSFTGTKFDRPEFNRMIADMRAGKIDCIVVKDLSRLGRNYLEAGDYIEKIFPFFGVRFIAVTDHYDSLKPNAAEDGLVVPLKNLINEAYVKDVSRKISSTYGEYKKKGIYVVKSAPYGYKKDPGDIHNLLVDEEVRGVVVRIFDGVLAGVGMAQIARELNDEGIMPPAMYWQSKGVLEDKGKKNVWEAERIKHILSNVVYVGDVEIGKTYSCYYKGITKEMPVQKGERVYIRDHHEAIIGRDAFGRVQEILRANREKKCGKKRGYARKEDLLKGLVYCGHCRKKMYFYYRKDRTKSGYTEYAIYRCGHASTAGGGDPVKNIRTEKLEALALELIRRHMKEYLDAKEELGRLNRLPSGLSAKAAAENAAGEIRRRREKAELFMKNLYEDFRDGILSEQEYLEMKAGYMEELQELDKELEETEAEAGTYGTGYAGREEMAEAFLKYAGADRLTGELAQAFIRRIYCYGDDRFEVEYRFADGLESLCGLIAERGGKDGESGNG